MCIQDLFYLNSHSFVCLPPSTSFIAKGQSENLKTLSWDNLVEPIHGLKIAKVFFENLFEGFRSLFIIVHRIPAQKFEIIEGIGIPNVPLSLAQAS